MRFLKSPLVSSLWLKRLFDIILASIFLLILIPILFCVSVGVYLSVGFPIFFVQERAGIYGKPFFIFKFRTMFLGKFADEWDADESLRMSRFGRFIRKASLDELPQLVNVIRGDMSLIGPRPLFLEYVEMYSDKQKRRLDMRPGITGLSQVLGRNHISWSSKLRLDVFYVDHWSWMLDFKIILLTPIKVFLASGVSTPGKETSSRFRG